MAVVSPSRAMPAAYPDRFELGLARLRDVYGLVPVEYPTTRLQDASPHAKAADLMAAFEDPDIAALWASAGGIDELKVLAHLDAARIAAHPKPFIGYSDNTNLHLYLFNLGMVSYHGALVMFQLAFKDGVDPTTHEALQRALFTGGVHQLQPTERVEESLDPWSTSLPGTGSEELIPATPWHWSGPRVRVEGPAWGGSLEVVDFHLRTGRYLMDNAAYRGCIGYFETSGELPVSDFPSRVLTCMGERGLLGEFGAIMWGQPATWSQERPLPTDQRHQYAAEQREVVQSVVAEYNPHAPVVFGVDFGHTRPQAVIPCGGTVVVDGLTQSISITY